MIRGVLSQVARRLGRNLPGQEAKTKYGKYAYLFEEKVPGTVLFADKCKRNILFNNFAMNWRSNEIILTRSSSMKLLHQLLPSNNLYYINLWFLMTRKCGNKFIGALLIFI